MIGALGALGLLLASAASAAEVRLGLFVGHDEGLPGDVSLVFAESDAEKMRDLFVTWGGLERRDATLLVGARARSVEIELQKLQSRVQALHDRGDEAFLVFYYSGHGDGTSLHLGPSKLPYDELRTALEQTGADVRVAMVDACQSGGLVRRKGGQRGPAMAFATPTAESMRGTAIITSSAASELSQESDQIGGGFFTHYLHTALSGGADRNRDGEVSLAEAYDYVHVETAFRTRDAIEAQTPHGDFDLSGAGHVILTRLEPADAHLSFLGDLQGAYSVWDESRKRYVAEVDGASALELAVRPGVFYVHRRMPGWLEEATYQVRRGETRSVLAEDFETIAYEAAASKGDLDRQIRRARLPDLSLRFVAGARGLGWQASSAYFSSVAVGGFEARWLSRRTSYWSADVLAGRGVTDLSFEGLAPVRTVIGTTSLAASAGVATRPALVRAGIGGRAGITWLTRRFPEWDVAPQAAVALTAGGNTWVGLYRGRFSLDLQLNVVAMITNWDDNDRWPGYSDLLLAVGYRF